MLFLPSLSFLFFLFFVFLFLFFRFYSQNERKKNMKIQQKLFFKKTT